MHAAKRSQERAERGTCSFTTIAVDLAHTIAIVITRPLVLSVIDGRVLRLDPMVAAILVGVDDCSRRWTGFGQNAVAGRLVTMSDDPAALFARLTTDDMNDWRSVVVIGPMSRLLIRAATGRVIRVVMRLAFFPPRSDRSHLLRTSGRPSGRVGHSRSGWIEVGDDGYARFAARDAIHARGGRSARPWRCPEAAALTRLDAYDSLRRRCRLRAYSSHRSRDSGRHHSDPSGETGDDWCSHNAGRQSHQGANVAPARGGTSYHQTGRQSENRSWRTPSVHGFRGKYTTLARLLDMSLYFK